MNLYPLGKFLISTVCFPLYRIKVIGKENFPKQGGVLLCTNHIDNLDPPIVGITCPRTVHFMAKEELFDKPILKTLLPKVQAYPVKRGMSDREAFRKTIKLLREDKVVGLFPEGTRSKTGEIGKGLAGAGFFALKGGDAKVVPCAIIGPYKAFSQLKVVYGEAMDMTPYRERKASAEEVTEAIMAEISKLIEQYK
ncbi:1-acyl-sn-glycerol-3-phosphate acyltransferase [Sporosarcina sp. P21c]|uniref:lysophospholipid acyltransferase family protein n=1 Tax=Sporosarcina TaxID=1569 RepID=UPI000A16A0CA|nr:MULTISPECIES: lysophospholipid acyltransferase family protein [Sporosarcina]ARJ40179.1 acyl-phosphate glycerol 3-phosphate acyltransferase [Sporosarcina ureae]PIC68620.1 1-acyl-sn-glycerol-3-phosphate acyltransferase [Sporosarcina sp. P16a]PIC84606.1 1-acyl-sn-glycerol-3-phosphate acyltransferase [Sporosarcina sp. P1]PIC91194.1 1-acyl-sn-glycerol-3-phosphate acyltransferase [Sporosarcina sp. P21c]PIC93673.1 1-acyl-sn-glycerol-3-phosphate acyltransferase [Sporosarcina sp. P25]